MQQYALYENGASPACADMAYQDRPRIVDLMNAAVLRPLTAIVANVGFGKTHAASTLYDDPDNAVIWLQLTKLDNLAPRLWERLSYGIGQYDKALSEEMLSVGFPESIQSHNYLFRLIAEGITKSKYHRWIIVLDDSQLIEEPKIFDLLDIAINANLSNLSIVLISDGRININLTEFKAKGMLSSITQDDLRLKKEEIAEYYAMRDI